MVDDDIKALRKTLAADDRISFDSVMKKLLNAGLVSKTDEVGGNPDPTDEDLDVQDEIDIKAHQLMEKDDSLSYRDAVEQVLDDPENKHLKVYGKDMPIIGSKPE